MHITVDLNDADLLARMKNFEDHFVERKTSGDKKSDWLKTVVAFANSAPNGYPCVLYLGVKDSGEIETPQVNLDSMQKTFNQEMKNAYPPVPYLTKIVNDGKRQALAVIVLGSELRPHFAGLSYVRRGSESLEASEEQFAELIAQRNSKAAVVLQWKGKNVTVISRTAKNHPGGASETQWPNSTVLIDCSQFYVTLQSVPHVPPESFPLSRVEMNFDNLRGRLQLEILDLRSPWDVEQELHVRQVVGQTMTRNGQQLLRQLLMRRRILRKEQFMPEIPLDTQNNQMQIAMTAGIVEYQQETAGQQLTYYIVNPDMKPVLERVLPEFLK